MVLVKQWSIVAQLVQWYLVKPAGLSFRVRAPLVAGFAVLAQLFSSREFLSSNFSRTKRSINFKSGLKSLSFVIDFRKISVQEKRTVYFGESSFLPTFWTLSFWKEKRKAGKGTLPFPAASGGPGGRPSSKIRKGQIVTSGLLQIRHVQLAVHSASHQQYQQEKHYKRFHWYNGRIYKWIYETYLFQIIKFNSYSNQHLSFQPL